MSQADRPGVFVTFEGGDGAGKTTHIKFLASALRSQGREVVCVREPGGTKAGEMLRSIVLDTRNENLSHRAELLIYEAARAQIVHEVIIPALERGAVVLCDRFADSTLAYQGYGRGLSLDFVRNASDFACQGLVPHRTVLMRTPGKANVGLKRATRHTGGDRMEKQGVDFHERVNQAFCQIVQDDPQRIRVVESSESKPVTARRVFSAVADVFGWDPGNLPFDDAFFARAESFYGKHPRKERRRR